MILTIIIAIIISFIISVRFSARQFASTQQHYYGKFIAANFLLLTGAITAIYSICQHDEKGVRFLLMTLSFMVTQIIVVLVIGLVVRFRRKKMRV